MPGLLVTFEGIDGSGKSTQVELLRKALDSRRPVVVREPGGTPLGEGIRDILLHSRHSIAPVAEAHLFMAARAQLLADVIMPALEEGRIVIADRYHDSTLAYQGGGRGAGIEWPAAFPKPALTFLLAIPPDRGQARQAAAGKRADRMESAGADFQRAVAEAYERLAAAEPERWVRIDADQPSGRVHSEVMASMSRLLQEVRPSS